ncbi:hypothetical protein LAZ67_18000572 [Cordylochernes scorpioides]|uniref:Uncharacterized protein n=1 Tax=Cordylochernes scorpioides TaxID=51811 RepID=A0ABY6LHS2_9ARAC|nr:hypothetical protein LAZ67_18000572 [Cordylochernes scorpioides]
MIDPVGCAIFYGRNTSMICSVLKRKESIKSVTPAKGLMIISKLRTSLHENMEKLLMVWVTEKQLQGDTLTQTIICEKAKAIYGDLLKQTPQTSIDEASEDMQPVSNSHSSQVKMAAGEHDKHAQGFCATRPSTMSEGTLLSVKLPLIARVVFQKCGQKVMPGKLGSFLHLQVSVSLTTGGGTFRTNQRGPIISNPKIEKPLLKVGLLASGISVSLTTGGGTFRTDQRGPLISNPKIEKPLLKVGLLASGSIRQPYHWWGDIPCYGRSTSMICSVLKRKESIKSVTPAKGLMIISKLRTSLHENMEKLLMVWVTEKQLQGDTLTQTIICEKAKAIYGDLLKQTPQTSIDEASEDMQVIGFEESEAEPVSNSHSSQVKMAAGEHDKHAQGFCATRPSTMSEGTLLSVKLPLIARVVFQKCGQKVMPGKLGSFLHLQGPIISNPKIEKPLLKVGLLISGSIREPYHWWGDIPD